MTARLITLDRWASENYGEAAPSKRTLIRWAKNDMIQPPAEKHGRTYFVIPDAHYGAANDPKHDSQPKKAPPRQPVESASAMIAREIRERKASARA